MHQMSTAPATFFMNPNDDRFVVPNGYLYGNPDMPPVR
jgi:hypothetical protein